MIFFTFLSIFMLGGDLWCLWAGDRALRRIRHPRAARSAWAAFIGALLVGLLLLLLARGLKMQRMIMPEICVIAVFIWHFILLPIAVGISAPWVLIGRTAKLLRKKPVDAKNPVPLDHGRREFLTRIAVITPPLALALLTGQSVATEDDLILTRRDLAIADLPPGLEGMTIAHVTDPHLGSFISDRKVRRIIEMTNNLDADLVLQTGDLINASLADLPDGIAMVKQFHSRYGVYCCQGNHDVMVNRRKFEIDTIRGGLNMLLDEARDIRVRGQMLRLIAPRWTGYEDRLTDFYVREVVKKAPKDGMFTILTAHHPHAFDTAAALGIPLTLSGHTHGGQIALTRNIGVGPLMYRYWSGAYQKGDSTCFVSNGTGNWFPLRINVPCEIVHLTLRRATTA